MIKFVTTDSGSYDRKRKHPQRACDNCRKRKRRCHHSRDLVDLLSLTSTSPATNISTSTPTQKSASSLQGYVPERVDDSISKTTHTPTSTGQMPQGTTGVPLSTQSITPTQARRTPSNAAAIEDSRPLDSRFVGALNPEGVFLAAASPDNFMGTSSACDAGIWLAEKLGHPDHRFEALPTQSPSSSFYGFDPSILKVVSPILSREALSTVPSRKHCDALSGTYFRKIHPIFPVIDESTYRQLPDASPSRILLTQGICLAASMDFKSKPHLVFAEGDTPWGFRNFGRRILAAMRMCIELGLVSDKIVLMQAQALMSFFVEGQEGSETSTLMLGRAIQYVHSLGVHLKVRDENTDSEYAKTLFCCIWVLDRLNAAFHGRPVIMHERDMSRPLQECFQVQTPPFRLMCCIAELLDRVIRIYRPNNVEEEDLADFPLFEDLVLRCDASHIHPSFLVTTEVLYHAVAMLSCRTTTVDGDNTSQTAARTRRALSVEQLKAILSSDIPDQLVLFPFIPYSVSVSLSVAYHDLRRGKIGTHRARARDTMKTNCRTLENLGEIFWSAGVMAEMGNKTLKELDRVYLNVTGNKPLGSQDNPVRSVQEATQDPANRTDLHEPSTWDYSFADDQDYDPFDIPNISDLNPFGMFDPDFDLEAVDACLEQNLDLGIPNLL